MREDAPRAVGAPAPAGAPAAALAASAERLRDLERRAFARPNSRGGAADAAAAAAELPRLRALTPIDTEVRIAGIAQSVDPGELPEDDPDFPPTLGERLTATATAFAARAVRCARGLTRRDLRRAGASALALGLASTVGGVLHATAVAPPPAYAIFDFADQAPENERAPAGVVTIDQSFRERGALLLSGPHVFGERDDALRLAVYREWISDSLTEVCATIVAESAWPMHTTCVSEQSFRAEGVVGTFERDGFRLDYSWSPDGAHSIVDSTEGAETVEEIRALGIPALDALETVAEDVPLSQAVFLDPGGALAGPLLLGEVDGWIFVGALVRSQDAMWQPGDDRPQFCLLASSGQGGTRACARAELFLEDGIELQVSDGLLANWDASGAFDAGLP
ncbi:hypothetical protein [Microcella alkalica]|uniref:hypothetical protein n=1 Tax=Microcella alkalica TaxID=355930 RepID=UPI0031D6AF6C